MSEKPKASCPELTEQIDLLSSLVTRARKSPRRARDLAICIKGLIDEFEKGLLIKDEPVKSTKKKAEPASEEDQFGMSKDELEDFDKFITEQKKNPLPPNLQAVLDKIKKGRR